MELYTIIDVKTKQKYFTLVKPKIQNGKIIYHTVISNDIYEIGQQPPSIILKILENQLNQAYLMHNDISLSNFFFRKMNSKEYIELSTILKKLNAKINKKKQKLIT